MATTYAALLRGIDVGGHRKLPMAWLRELLTGLGHTGAATYLQSGNAVDRGPRRGQRGFRARGGQGAPAER